MSVISRREFLDLSWRGASAWFLAACGRAPLPPDILPTLPPLLDLLSTDEVDRKGGVTIARVELTEKALGGEKTGKANLEVISRALKSFGFEDGALEKQQVALWAPIETANFLMYKVHPDTKELFSIGRLYAYHPRAQRFLEVPVLLRAELSADGQSFSLKSIEAVSLDVNMDEAKKRTYAVRAATLQVLDDEKKTAELATDPTIAPRFSFEIESTINGQNQPVIVGTRKYALGMLLADLNGSQMNGDAAYTNEAIFRRFVIPAQELATFKDQPAVLRESQVSHNVQEEISTLIADKKITRAKIVALTTEQWGGAAIASKDAAIVFTPDLVSDVAQESKDADKRKLQGKYFLAVKAPKKIDDSGSLVRTISLSSQIDPEWQLIEFPLKLVTREDGSTYLELINELFGIRLAVGVKVEDKKLQVLGDQLFAFAFGPSQLHTQAFPLQVAGENLQRMFNEMKEVKGPEIVWKKDRFSTQKELEDALLNVKNIRSSNPELISNISANLPKDGVLWISRIEGYLAYLTVPLVLTKVAIEKKSSGEMLAHFLYLHSKTMVNSSPFAFRMTVPLGNVVVSQDATPAKPFTANSLSSVLDDKKRIEMLQKPTQDASISLDKPYITFRSPATKSSKELIQPNSGAPINSITDGFVAFVKSKINDSSWLPFTDKSAFVNTLAEHWRFLKDAYIKINGEKKVTSLISELGEEWISTDNLPQFGSTIGDKIYCETFFFN